MTAPGNQYLAEMGVEVWVLRRKIAGTPAMMPTLQAETPTPAGGNPSPAGDVAPIPKFHLCFMTTPQVSLVFSVSAEADAVPRPLHRFAEDVLLALGAASPAVATVRWPMVQSAHIDQSEHAARVVLRQRLEHCAPYLVIFGNEAANRVRDLSQRPGIELDDIQSYLEAPLTKRTLWQRLLEVKPGATT